MSMEDMMISTLDIEKAKEYYEKKMNKPLSYREVKILSDNELRNCILNGGVLKKEVE